MNEASSNPYQSPQADIRPSVGSGGVQPISLKSYKGRMGRIRFIAYSMWVSGGIMMVGYIPFIAAMIAVEAQGAPQALLVITGLLLFVAYIVGTVFGVFYTIQRCHDFDQSGWLCLVAFIPLGVLIFWFVPGTEGANQFGDPPPPNKAIHFVLAAALPLAFVLGIFAAIAIPAYVDYMERVQTGMNIVEVIKPLFS